MTTSNSIQRLLVANRGEIARRIFRSCRALGITAVAVFSDADVDEPFVHDADMAVALGGVTPAESYLRVDKLLSAALVCHCDAVHPGYGFLAENADFAQAVLDAGIIWVGPEPDTISAMGSKIEARARMDLAGVPIVPGETLNDAEDQTLQAAARRIGFPLIVKASAGGGGKGMRIVHDPDRLSHAAAAARREAGGAFGDDKIFLERYIANSRHVEIQVFGDTHGNVVPLFERDCSIQRRHQKIIEEVPSPVVDADLRRTISEAAVAAARALSYVGAGTVEFLVTPDREFFFLEVNTRLQVEHPVTEMVTGLDLVVLQLSVAEGKPLPPEALHPTMSGHAIEARLYAEDPKRGFLPMTGTVDRFAVPETVRVDAGVADGSTVTPYYDPMLAKVIAHGRTREDAARKLADALHRAVIDGVVTNRDFLVRVLRHPEFLSGAADIGFLARHDPVVLGASSLDAESEGLHALAAALALQVRRRTGAARLKSLPSGWRNNPSQLQQTTFAGNDGEIPVSYRFDRTQRLAEAHVGGAPVSPLRLHRCDHRHVDIETDGIRRQYEVRLSGDGRVHIQSDLGAVTFTEQPRFPAPEAKSPPGSLSAPMPGTVLRVHAVAGEQVTRGQVLIVIEAMKMEHEIVAPHDGLLSGVSVEEGHHVEAGMVLAVLSKPGHEAEPAV